MEANPRRPRAGHWLIQAGAVLMAFGVGGFLGVAVGRTPMLAVPPQGVPTLNLAERHANNAEYYARRSIVGISRVQERDACLHSGAAARQQVDNQ